MKVSPYVIEDNKESFYYNLLQKDGDLLIPGYMRSYSKKIKEFVAEKDSEKLESFLCNNQVKILCYHFTRLTKKEIEDIKHNGIKLGSKEFFYKKINNLPRLITDSEKEVLVNHVKKLKETKADGRICLKYGDFKTEDDTMVLFLKNWGGETIYDFYDHNIEEINDPMIKKLKMKLVKISFPCIIFVGVEVNQLSEYEIDDLCKDIIKGDEIENTVYFKEKPKVLCVERLEYEIKE